MTSVKCCHLLILPEHYRHWHDINPYTSNILVKRDVSEKKQLIWLGVEYWNILLIFHVNVLYIKCSLNTVTASRKFEILTLGIWISQWFQSCSPSYLQNLQFFPNCPRREALLFYKMIIFISLGKSSPQTDTRRLCYTLFEGTWSLLWSSIQNLEKRTCQF